MKFSFLKVNFKLWLDFYWISGLLRNVLTYIFKFFPDIFFCNNIGILDLHQVFLAVNNCNSSFVYCV